jgi:hypothetical protein
MTVVTPAKETIMKQTQNRNEQENPLADSSGSRWVAPRLSRLSAGNAENNQNSGNDTSSEFS